MNLRAKTLLAIIVTFFLVGGTPAQAHTSVVNTTPLYKSTLTKFPPQIAIQFSEDLMEIGNRPVNTISLSAPDGSDVRISSITIQKSVITAVLADDVHIDGTYLVSYRVVSADGHPVSGSYELYLNRPSSSPAGSVENHDQHPFLHLHQTHLIQSGVVLILVILWWGYRRFNREAAE